MWQAWERRENCTRFRWESQKGRRQLGRPRRRWEDEISMKIRGIGWGAWIGFDWLRIGTGGVLL
jgi:hypothetical protein